MQEQAINKQQAVQIVAAHKVTGKVFGVLFVKKDSTKRTMACRFGVTAYHRTEGTPSTTAHIPKYITVFDMHKNSYRNVNLDTLVHIVAGGVKYILA